MPSMFIAAVAVLIPMLAQVGPTGAGAQPPATRPHDAPETRDPPAISETPTTRATSTTQDTAGRTRLTDFDDAEANARWRMVNDNVMGGRSKGDVRFADGVMTFLGDINTNGGGFSSVRLPIEPGTLAGAKQIVMRIKPDGRTPYRLQVADSNGHRREILHQGKFAVDSPAGAWQTVTVDLAAMQPTFHGEPIEAPALDPAAAVLLGFILNDAVDGPFALQIDWIDVVR